MAQRQLGTAPKHPMTNPRRSLTTTKRFKTSPRRPSTAPTQLRRQSWKRFWAFAGEDQKRKGCPKIDFGLIYENANKNER